MKPKDPVLTRLKNKQPGRTGLWLVAFAALAVLSLVFLIIAKSWILKLLFLLITVGAGFYCWLLIESMKIAPKRAKMASPSNASPLPSQAEAEGEVYETEDGEVFVEETTPPDEPRAGGVFVTEKGDKYHLDRNCSGLRFADSVEEMTVEQAVSASRKPCSLCSQQAKQEE